MAIGAQNAFVLSQGLARRFVFPVALTCTLADILLIAIGVAGAATIAAAASGIVARLLAFAGASYILWFGFGAARAAWRGDALAAEDSGKRTLRGTIAAAVALSLLNPHAILDMTVVFGSASAKFPPAQKLPFAAGGAAASALWFFGLGFGASRLAPLLGAPAAWRAVNAFIAAMMLVVAAPLMAFALGL